METNSPVYLLPCSCGREVPVQRRHAGQEVVCTCGRALEVPTLLEIESLRRAEVSPSPVTPTEVWGLRQRLVLSGGAVFLAGLGTLVYLLATLPSAPRAEPDLIKHNVQRMPLVHTMRLWENLRQGLNPHQPPQQEKAVEARFQHLLWLGASSLLTLAGVGLLVGGLAVRPKA